MTTRTRRTIVIVLVVCAILAGGAAATILLWPQPAPPDIATQSEQDVVRYVASEQFSKLPEPKRQVYLQAVADRFEGRPPDMRDVELSDEQRDRLRENVRPMFRQRMEQRIDAFFALPEEQRDAYLDDMIDRMQEMRNRRPRDAGRGDRQGRRGGGFTPERMKQRLENTPPDRRAKMAEFFRAMRQRMEDRGIEPPGRVRG